MDARDIFGSEAAGYLTLDSVFLPSHVRTHPWPLSHVLALRCMLKLLQANRRRMTGIAQRREKSTGSPTARGVRRSIPTALVVYLVVLLTYSMTSMPRMYPLRDEETPRLARPLQLHFQQVSRRFVQPPDYHPTSHPGSRKPPSVISVSNKASKARATHRRRNAVRVCARRPAHEPPLLHAFTETTALSDASRRGTMSHARAAKYCTAVLALMTLARETMIVKAEV